MAALGSPAKKRLLVFVVAYHAERTIQNVLRRIPASLSEHDTEILIIDDSSEDRTFQTAKAFEESPFRVTVLFNPVNQRYGGNQKIGFHYAMKEGFDFVALVHGDGQYAPELLPELLRPLLDGEADAVFGSRMMRGFEALKGGMPLYKFVGNKVLTAIQNRMLKSAYSEFHSGYRLYSVRALASVPFQLNTNGFHFDTEIMIQFLRAGLRIRELPIPTYYGDEICRVNGLAYAFNVLKAVALARAQELGVLYERKFDVTRHDEFSNYQPKLTYRSPHTMALERVRDRSRVIDIGCASGYMARELNRKGCRVTGIDQYTPPDGVPLERFVKHDLNDRGFPLDIGSFDYVLLLDVIEHLQSPESFVEALRLSWKDSTEARVIASTGNIAFFATRLLLLVGLFHYGRRGILDLTHTRLFTFATFRNLFEQAGYEIEEVHGVPAPYPLALGDNAFSRFLLWANRVLIRVSKSVFSYQIFVVARPQPPLGWLLERAIECGREKTGSDTGTAIATRRPLGSYRS
jgi:glycosyltransferase involved in cell wall biosynthesis